MPHVGRAGGRPLVDPRVASVIRVSEKPVLDIRLAVSPAVDCLELSDVVARQQSVGMPLLANARQHFARLENKDTALGAVGHDQALVAPGLARVGRTEQVVVNTHLVGWQRVALVVVNSVAIAQSHGSSTSACPEGG